MTAGNVDDAGATRCAKCGRHLGHRFEVTRYDARGVNRGVVNVCSIVCLIRWAYDYGVNRGVAGVVSIHTAFQQLATMLRGEKKT